MLIELQDIQLNSKQHSPSSEYFQNFQQLYGNAIARHYSSDNSTFVLGERRLEISLPNIRQGKVSSKDLFGMNELIIFAFYDLWVGTRYKKILDLGANIGLHSIVLSGFGGEVTALEPDPLTFEILRENIGCQRFYANIELLNSAAHVTEQVSAIFLRVSQNRTGSHLLGARSSRPYGGHEEITVNTVSFKKLLEKKFDFVKMDVEGSEADLIESIDLQLFQETDYLLEIGSASNSQRIWDCICASGINAFSQKIGWAKTTKLDDLPTHHSEGSLFISYRDTMDWWRGREKL